MFRGKFELGVVMGLTEVVVLFCLVDEYDLRKKCIVNVSVLRMLRA